MTPKSIPVPVLKGSRLASVSQLTQHHHIHSTSKPHPRDIPRIKKSETPPPSHDHFPIEHIHLDQNTHLKHAVSSQGGDIGRDLGKGNAAPEPKLPSQIFESEEVKKRTGHELNLGGTESIYPVEKQKRNGIASEKV